MIQWYPGHVAKWDRALKEQLKLVDVVIQVLDSRLPHTTDDATLRERLAPKPVLVLLNKQDLADAKVSEQWAAEFKAQGQAVHSYDALHGPHKQKLIQQLLVLGEPVWKKLEAKGMKRRPLRVLMIGMPNVGKSTILNSIVGKKKVKTGHKPGVTREPQWVRIHPQLDMLDYPGIIPPALSDETSGMLLATVSGVSDAAFDNETVAQFLLDRVNHLYPQLLYDHYEVEPEQSLTLETVGRQRRFIKQGDVVDIERTASVLLQDFRHGRWGRRSLEWPTAQGALGESTEASATSVTHEG